MTARSLRIAVVSGCIPPASGNAPANLAANLVDPKMNVMDFEHFARDALCSSHQCLKTIAHAPVLATSVFLLFSTTASRSHSTPFRVDATLASSLYQSSLLPFFSAVDKTSFNSCHPPPNKCQRHLDCNWIVTPQRLWMRGHVSQICHVSYHAV